MPRTDSPLDADGTGRPWKPGQKALATRAFRQGVLAGRRGTRTRYEASKAWWKRNEHTELGKHRDQWSLGWVVGETQREGHADAR